MVYSWFMVGEEQPQAGTSAGDDETAQAGKQARQGLRLTSRDRQLLGVLATARYLSSEQIQRLFFSGKTEAACRGRLFILGGLGNRKDPHPFIRRLRFRSFEGRWHSVWTPTLHGYCIAQNVLGTEVKIPAYDVSANFLEHSIRLNDVLVGLLQPSDRRIPTISRARLRWIPSDSARLPWRGYEQRLGRVKRVIQPDAILEIPSLQRRFFLECEMGTHSIISPNPNKYGATSNKLDRYNTFMRTYADAGCTKTHYDERFPDRWAAELLFLVQSPIRRDHVTQAIEKAKSLWNDRSLRARALTFEEAQLRLAELIETTDRQALDPEPLVPLSRRDYYELAVFYNASMASLKLARAQVRGLRMPHLKLPEYPPNYEKAGDVLHKLRPALFPNSRPAT